MRARGRHIAIHDLLLTLLCAAFLAVPLAGAFLPVAHPAESNVEHRRLSPFPRWPASFAAWVGFPKAFDAFAHDRFGFRGLLLSGYRWLQASVFGDSASPDAFVGRSGWLYLTENGSLADMRGASAYTEAELRNDVEQINARGELLAVRHVRYGFVVFPDKHTIYPEFLPRGLYGGFARRRLNALDAAMAGTGHDYYFDATSALRRNAGESPFPLYYKSDTHWNPWGAWLGYRAWQAADGKRLGLTPFEYRFRQFRLPHRSAHGDLGRMSGYWSNDPDIYPPSDSGCTHLQRWTAPPTIRHIVDTIPSHLSISECGGSGNALVVHDSFMDSIARYVSASYGVTWYVWKYVDDSVFASLVQVLRPETVIVERVERLMQHLEPVNLDVLVQRLGVVGEPAAVDGAGNLVIGGDVAHRKSPMDGVASGAIDRAVRDGNEVHVEGWAGAGASPPAAVMAVSDGKVVGEAPVTLYRPDVARVTGSPGLMWAGFRLTLPVAALHPSAALKLYLVDFDTYGEFALDARSRQWLQGAARPGVAIGSRVSIDRYRSLLVAGQRRSATGEPVAGSLDQIVRQGGQVRLAGWARIGDSAPVEVVAVVDGRIVGTAAVDVPRGDVAAAMKNPSLERSGFEMTLPRDAIASGGSALSLYVLDRNHYGELSLSGQARKRLTAALR